jgi:hypothetical protein
MVVSATILHPGDEMQERRGAITAAVKRYVTTNDEWNFTALHGT